MRKLIILLHFAVSAALMCFAEDGDGVLQVSKGGDYTPVPWDEIFRINFSTADSSMIISGYDGTETVVPFNNSIHIPSGTTIPLLKITTEESLEEIPDKENYKAASLTLRSFDHSDDIVADVSIRGRGNSSWLFEKKPYRLKFNKKISLGGLPKAKSYVLLANYTDTSLLQFAVATKIGQMLELPYTNHVVPVDVVFNGIYKGSYILTNKPGINSGSVDIDEESSVMWELDVNYDEDMKFTSPRLNLPVMLADPDMDEETFEKWKADFIEMERAALNMKAADLVDMEVFAKYLLVYEIMGVDEIGYPKSVKLFKIAGAKYIFGPIWDFDVAMGYRWEQGISYSTDRINEPVWRNPLFKFLERDSLAKNFRRQYWNLMKDRLPELLEYIDGYAATIRSSAYRNLGIWPKAYGDFDESVEKMKAWLVLRFSALEEIIK